MAYYCHGCETWIIKDDFVNQVLHYKLNRFRNLQVHKYHSGYIELQMSVI